MLTTSSCNFVKTFCRSRMCKMLDQVLSLYKDDQEGIPVLESTKSWLRNNCKSWNSWDYWLPDSSWESDPVACTMILIFPVHPLKGISVTEQSSPWCRERVLDSQPVTSGLNPGPVACRLFDVSKSFNISELPFIQCEIWLIPHGICEDVRLFTNSGTAICVW